MTGAMSWQKKRCGIMCSGIFVSKGMCADWAIHDSVNQNGIHNLHFHLMLTLRPVEENGKWGEPSRERNISLIKTAIKSAISPDGDLRAGR